MSVFDKPVVFVQETDPLGLPLNAMPLDGLLAIFRNPSLPIPLRFKAMAEAAKYMHPRSFAGRLERAIERSNKIKNGAVLVNGTKLIEAKLETIRRRI